MTAETMTPKPESEIRRVAIVARSTPAIDAQKAKWLAEELRKWCVKDGCEARIYFDERPHSTRRPRRFDQMMKDARDGKLDLVLFFSMDQLPVSNIAETRNLLAELSELGVQWCSFSQPGIDSFEHGEFVFNLLDAPEEQRRQSWSIKAKAGAKKSKRVLGRSPKITLEQLRAAKEKIAPTRNLNSYNGMISEWSPVELAEELNVSRATIYRLLARERASSQKAR